MRQMKKKALCFLMVCMPFLLTGCSEEIRNAGYNTLLGMGMAFFVLALISVVIALFSLVNKASGTKTKTQEIREQGVDQAISRIEEQEALRAEQTNDDEIAAVIAAAIAAYEADSGGAGGYRVTSIRRRRREKQFYR